MKYRDDTYDGVRGMSGPPGYSGEKPFYASILKKKKKGNVSGLAEKNVQPPALKPAGNRKENPERSIPGNLDKKGCPLSAHAHFSCSEAVYSPVSDSLAGLLSRFGDIVREVFPLDRKRLFVLPKNINTLSHLLTDSRSDRRVGYMNDPANISAYVHYFMWWNLVRFSRLFAGLFPGSRFPDRFYAVDLGSGPLTSVCAMWIACPELRQKKITWYCVDISRDALAAGEEIFLRLAALTGGEPWEIIRVRGQAGISVREKASLVICANVFNEMFSSDLENEKTKSAASRAFSLVDEYAAVDSKILIIEPGNPEGGSFVSWFRKKAVSGGYSPVSPCPHAGRCPFPGGRGKKWCHFAFPVDYAPEKLKALSEQAGLSKDRAVLSFVCLEKVRRKLTVDAAGVPDISGTAENPPGIKTKLLPVRVISDGIRLPGGKTGRYGCSAIGMVLLSGRDFPEQGKRGGNMSSAEFLKQIPFGALVNLKLNDKTKGDNAVDSKSGAIIINLLPLKA